MRVENKERQEGRKREREGGKEEVRVERQRTTKRTKGKKKILNGNYSHKVNRLRHIVWWGVGSLNFIVVFSASLFNPSRDLSFGLQNPTSRPVPNIV